MRLRYIELFHAVLSTGSLTGAANLLNVSQPAASKALQQAESHLGFPLFSRVRGRLQPTQQALLMRHQIDKLMRDLYDLRRLAVNITRPETHPLRVTSTPALAQVLLPDAIAQTGKAYPDTVIELATQHLVEAGHKRIAFLGGRAGVVYEQRLRGYTRALKAAGLRFDERLVIGSDPNRSGGRAAMDALLALKSPPAAAVCYNDITAFGAIVSLGEHGLKPGTDFAILGFDNVIAAEHSNPPLSTIDIRPSELGEHAAATLMARIDNPKLKRQVFLAEPRLLLRQSG